jgi:hypothetical protein
MAHELLIDRDGRRTLRVFYDPSRCDWSECIHVAMDACHLEGKSVLVVAMPMNSSGWIDKR